jgi:hypothetical protein
MSPHPIEVDPASMAGSWSMERDLLDRLTGQRGEFTGRLTIDAAPHGFDWTESGHLTWDGHTLTASRQLALRRVDGQWWMTFADGRPFHPWRIGEDVLHPCAEDLYRGRITVASPDDSGRPVGLQISWDVTGPRKHQHIVTRLVRIATA